MPQPPALVLERVLDFFLPPLCVACERYTESVSGVCEYCNEKLERFEHPFCLRCLSSVDSTGTCSVCGDKTYLYALGNYEGPLREIIIQFKFHRLSKPIPHLVAELCDRFGGQIKDLAADYLIPVPLHSSRLYHRGFNQAEVMAKLLSGHLDIPIDTISIRRAKGRPPQAKLHLTERVSNIEQAYEATGEIISDSRVILVDDVITSGATIREVKQTLEQAGVIIVGAISLAHGL